MSARHIARYRGPSALAGGGPTERRRHCVNLAGRQACPRRRCSAEGPLGPMPPGPLHYPGQANWKAPQRIGGRCDTSVRAWPGSVPGDLVLGGRSSLPATCPAAHPHDCAYRGRQLMRPYDAKTATRRLIRHPCSVRWAVLAALATGTLDGREPFAGCLPSPRRCGAPLMRWPVSGLRKGRLVAARRRVAGSSRALCASPCPRGYCSPRLGAPRGHERRRSIPSRGQNTVGSVVLCRGADRTRTDDPLLAKQVL